MCLTGMQDADRAGGFAAAGREPCRFGPGCWCRGWGAAKEGADLASRSVAPRASCGRPGAKPYSGPLPEMRGNSVRVKPNTYVSL